MGCGKPELDSVMANIQGCLGSGCCNIGCKFGKKLSMLDTILPQTQLDYPGTLEIIANCEVLKFKRNGNRMISLIGKFKSGKELTVKGNPFISSAGAISSCILLLKSNPGPGQRRQKARLRLGTEITAAYSQQVNSYDG